MTKKYFKRASLALATLGIAVSPALAAPITWTGTTNGTWSDISNWDLLMLPATDGSDDVFFDPNNTAGAITSTLDSAWASSGSIKSLTFNAGGSRGYFVVPGAGVTQVSISGGITNLSNQAAKINLPLNFTASQALNAKNQTIFTDAGTWISANGVVVTLASGNNRNIQFYDGATDAVNFQGSFAQVGRSIVVMDKVTQYGRLGANTFYVSGVDTVNGGTGSPILQLGNSTNQTSGTFANDISFSGMSGDSFTLRGTPGTKGITVSLTGDWSGDIGAGSDSQGYGGVRFNSTSTIGSETALRFVLSGDNSLLTATGANRNASRYPIQVARGVLVVDNDNALGAGNSLLVGVGSENTGGISNTAGLLAANGRTINSEVRVAKNTNGSAVSQNVILGVDGSGSTGVFAGNIYLDSSATATQVPNLTLKAGAGSTVTFSGNLQNQGTAAANLTPVTIAGGGKVIFSGVNTYTGTTTISGGSTLQVDGSLVSALTVQDTGLLQGTGSIGSVSIAGTLAPGNSIGTLTADSVSFQTGGALEIELGAGVSDTLVTADLDLSNASLSLLGTADSATSYVIATYSGTLTGTFVSVSGLPDGYSLDYGTGSNSQIVLTVPEPAGVLGLLMLSGVAMIRRRRS